MLVDDDIASVLQDYLQCRSILSPVGSSPFWGQPGRRVARLPRIGNPKRGNAEVLLLQSPAFRQCKANRAVSVGKLTAKEAASAHVHFQVWVGIESTAWISVLVVRQRAVISMLWAVQTILRRGGRQAKTVATKTLRQVRLTPA